MYMCRVGYMVWNVERGIAYGVSRDWMTLELICESFLEWLGIGSISYYEGRQMMG